MSESVAADIKIDVDTRYLKEQSAPESGQYAFAYTITIRNLGEQGVRLLNRHWIITDADGEVQEVRGAGVVGEQPLIKPGEHYRYTSGTMMPTPVGTMEGSYEMITEEGRPFITPIEAFTLVCPGALH